MNDERQRLAVALLPRLRRMAQRIAAMRRLPSPAWADIAQDGALAILADPGTPSEGRAVVIAERAMVAASRRFGPVSASRSSGYRWARIRAAAFELEDPSDAAVGRAVGASAEAVRTLRNAFEGEAVPVFLVGEDGEENEFLAREEPSAEALLLEADRAAAVRRAVGRLSSAQSATVTLRFGLAEDAEPLSVAEIAAARGVLRASAHTRLTAALLVLGRALRAWAP